MFNHSVVKGFSVKIKGLVLASMLKVKSFLVKKFKIFFVIV